MYLQEQERDLGVNVDSGWIESLTLIIFGCGCAQLLGMSEILRALFTGDDMIIGLMTNTSDLKAKDDYSVLRALVNASFTSRNTINVADVLLYLTSITFPHQNAVT